MSRKIEKGKRNHYGARIISSLISLIIDLGKRGIIIENITAGGATPAGRRLLLNFGLHEIPAKKPGKRIFTVDVQEAGSPVIMQYKEALKESRVLG